MINCKKTKLVLNPGPSLLRNEGGSLLRKEGSDLLRKERRDLLRKEESDLLQKERTDLQGKEIIRRESIEARYEVDHGLAGVLSHFYVIRTGENEPVRISHLSPNLEMMVVFNFGPPVSFSYGDAHVGQHTIQHVGIVGPLRKMMNYELGPGSDLLILHFVYDGFYRFMSLPPDSVTAVGINESYLTRHMHSLQTTWEMLNRLVDTEERIAALKTYLVDNITNSHPAIVPLLDSVEQIHDTSINPVKFIAGRASISERSVQLRFRKYTGYSSKELLRFLRFKQVLTFIISRPESKIDWFGLIVQYGYHDQSHLIKDFKYYTGVTPRQFVKLNDEGNICVSRG